MATRESANPQAPADAANVAAQLDALKAQLAACCAGMNELSARVRAIHRSVAGRYVPTAEVLAYGNNDYPAPVVLSTVQAKNAVVQGAAYVPPTLP